ncbi:hypothetical protein [Nonlabens sp.]|uniref:hypothetical protein n=1 Tax=Nonlabens sp. TaxID=1888209 RepID=UPI003F69E322
MRNLIAILLIITAHSNANGQVNHLTLENLYTDFVKSIKADNDEELRSFCTRVVMDKETLNFMRQQNMCYKGVPCKLDQQGETMEYVVDMYYKKLLRVKNRLTNENLLKNLELGKNIDYRFDTELIPAVKNKKTNETKIISYGEVVRFQKILKASDSLSKNDATFKGKNLNDYMELINVTIRGTDQGIALKSGKVEIHYSIGEVASVYGKKWSVVTIPKDSYSTNR